MRLVRSLVKEPVPVPLLVWLLDIVGLALVLQQTPRAETGMPPSKVISPPLVAVVLVMFDGCVVVTVGGSAFNVVNEPMSNCF